MKAAPTYADVHPFLGGIRPNLEKEEREGCDSPDSAEDAGSYPSVARLFFARRPTIYF